MFAIRPAVPDDAPVMHAIQMRAFAEEGRLCGNTQIPPLTETPADIEIHIRTQTALVVLYEGSIVGAARGIVESGVCTLRGICVEPASHGQGIGSALLRAVERAVRSARRFELTTNTRVTGNVRFYERRGYVVDALSQYAQGVVLAHMSKHGGG